MSNEGRPAVASAPPEKSRHHQRARQDRGAETRARLVEAALDVFGRQGFEASSTREIARRADANLAAIVYHFGSKEGLHRAVAEHVVIEIDSRLGPAIAGARDALAQSGADKIVARRLLQRIAEAHMATMLGPEEASAWARFIVREQMEPSPVFDLIVAFMAPMHGLVQNLVAILSDRDPDDEEAGIRAFTLISQVLVFRVAQPMVLRLMGRDGLVAADRTLITRIVTENIDRIVGVPVGTVRP